MADDSVDSLRAQLRDRGYLSYGIDRWFALDPWRSRTFWLELAIVAMKAAALVAAFGALAATAVVLIRNHPLALLETVELFLIYAAAWFVAASALVVAVGLLMKIRPELAIETPRALLIIGMLASAVLIALLGTWWYGFPGQALTLEIAVVVIASALLFIVSTIAISAALLSFSIHELQRIPTIHQKPRTIPVAIGALVLVTLLFVLVYATPQAAASTPPQIVIAPSTMRLALVAVDGLTAEIARSRPDIANQFPSIAAVDNVPAGSASERWATVGTGVPVALHRVRAIAGVRLAGGSHVLQSVSRWDYALLKILPAARIATPQPLPPTVRRRDFVWESLATRSVSAASVNWWTAEEAQRPALLSVTQETVFGAAKSDPIRIDQEASRRLVSALDALHPQFGTVYLPALDVILNRLDLDRATQLAESLRALDGVGATVTALRERGYQVLLVGAPGDGQSGHALIAGTLTLDHPRSLLDVAPTVLQAMGFPASQEMPGRCVLHESEQPRIATYGSRAGGGADTRLSQEYYDSLKSLGYIR